MTKKKASKQKVSLPQDFSSSPFKKLKGLSALAEQKSQLPGRADDLATSSVSEPTALSSDLQSFAEEMDSLGVRPLPGRVVRELPADKKIDKIASLSLPGSREESENEIFLDAVGTVDKLFKDDWPMDEPAKKASPRRMKQVERGQLKPEAELDLHGLTVDEASAKVGYFLRDVSYQGFQTVLIITGKGLHSSDGPVLRQAVEKILNSKREQVLEWGIAPRRYGGGGALIVFLRQVGAE